MNCPQLQNGICQVAAGIAGHAAVPIASHCMLCSKSRTPQAVNTVTVSLALNALKDSPAKHEEIRAEYANLFEPTATPKPTILKAVATATKAVAKYVAKGMPNTTPAQYEVRLALCNVCEKKSGSRCTVCNCVVAIKAKMKTEDCPIGKWPKLS